MSGKCGELLFWEGVKGPKSCSSEESASWCCLPLPPPSPGAKGHNWARFLKGGQPSFGIDRTMGKLIGVIWAHLNNNELINMPGFDLFWCMDSWQELWVLRRYLKELKIDLKKKTPNNNKKESTPITNLKTTIKKKDQKKLDWHKTLFSFF